MTSRGIWRFYIELTTEAHGGQLKIAQSFNGIHLARNVCSYDVCDTHSKALLTCAEVDEVLRATTATTPVPQAPIGATSAEPSRGCNSVLSCPARPARSATSKLFFGAWDQACIWKFWRDIVFLGSMVTRLHPLATGMAQLKASPIGAAAASGAGAEVVRSSLLACLSSAAWRNATSPRKAQRAASHRPEPPLKAHRRQIVALVHLPSSASQWGEWSGGISDPTRWAGRLLAAAERSGAHIVLTPALRSSLIPSSIQERLQVGLQTGNASFCPGGGAACVALEKILNRAVPFYEGGEWGGGDDYADDSDEEDGSLKACAVQFEWGGWGTAVGAVLPRPDSGDTAALSLSLTSREDPNEGPLRIVVLNEYPVPASAAEGLLESWAELGTDDGSGSCTGALAVMPTGQGVFVWGHIFNPSLLGAALRASKVSDTGRAAAWSLWDVVTEGGVQGGLSYAEQSVYNTRAAERRGGSAGAAVHMQQRSSRGGGAASRRRGAAATALLAATAEGGGGEDETHTSALVRSSSVSSRGAAGRGSSRGAATGGSMRTVESDRDSIASGSTVALARGFEGGAPSSQGGGSSRDAYMGAPGAAGGGSLAASLAQLLRQGAPDTQLRQQLQQLLEGGLQHHGSLLEGGVQQHGSLHAVPGLHLDDMQGGHAWPAAAAAAAAAPPLGLQQSWGGGGPPTLADTGDAGASSSTRTAAPDDLSRGDTATSPVPTYRALFRRMKLRSSVKQGQWLHAFQRVQGGVLQLLQTGMPAVVRTVQAAIAAMGPAVATLPLCLAALGWALAAAGAAAVMGRSPLAAVEALAVFLEHATLGDSGDLALPVPSDLPLVCARECDPALLITCALPALARGAADTPLLSLVTGAFREAQVAGDASPSVAQLQASFGAMQPGSLSSWGCELHPPSSTAAAPKTKPGRLASSGASSGTASGLKTPPQGVHNDRVVQPWLWGCSSETNPPHTPTSASSQAALCLVGKQVEEAPPLDPLFAAVALTRQVVQRSEQAACSFPPPPEHVCAAVTQAFPKLPPPARAKVQAAAQRCIGLPLAAALATGLLGSAVFLAASTVMACSGAFSGAVPMPPAAAAQGLAPPSDEAPPPPAVRMARLCVLQLLVRLHLVEALHGGGGAHACTAQYAPAVSSLRRLAAPLMNYLGGGGGAAAGAKGGVDTLALAHGSLGTSLGWSHATWCDWDPDQRMQEVMLRCVCPPFKRQSPPLVQCMLGAAGVITVEGLQGSDMPPPAKAARPSLLDALRAARSQKPAPESEPPSSGFGGEESRGSQLPPSTAEHGSMANSTLADADAVLRQLEYRGPINGLGEGGVDNSRLVTVQVRRPRTKKASARSVRSGKRGGGGAGRGSKRLRRITPTPVQGGVQPAESGVVRAIKARRTRNAGQAVPGTPQQTAAVAFVAATPLDVRGPVAMPPPSALMGGQRGAVSGSAGSTAAGLSMHARLAGATPDAAALMAERMAGGEDAEWGGSPTRSSAGLMSALRSSALGVRRTGASALRGSARPVRASLLFD